jgi:hypothetical protein
MKEAMAVERFPHIVSQWAHVSADPQPSTFFCFSGQEIQKVGFNDSAFSVSLFPPRIGKEDESVPDLAIIDENRDRKPGITANQDRVLAIVA